jgi:hypothetical protein
MNFTYRAGLQITQAADEAAAEEVAVTESLPKLESK